MNMISRLINFRDSIFHPFFLWLKNIFKNWTFIIQIQFSLFNMKCRILNQIKKDIMSFIEKIDN